MVTPAGGPGPGPETITDYMRAEHARLDGLLGDVCRLVDEQSLDQAATAFRLFAAGLRRHIRVEEELIFPLMLPLRSHERWGPTFVMRMEHIEILEIIVEMEAALDGDLRTFTGWLNRLRAVLHTHEVKESQVLFPAADDRVDDELRAILLAKIRAMLCEPITLP
jgi:iron-sulfur cluster repair protein YtfE (RIC family)